MNRQTCLALVLSWMLLGTMFVTPAVARSADTKNKEQNQLSAEQVKQGLQTLHAAYRRQDTAVLNQLALGMAYLGRDMIGDQCGLSNEAIQQQHLCAQQYLDLFIEFPDIIGGTAEPDVYDVSNGNQGNHTEVEQHREKRSIVDIILNLIYPLISNFLPSYLNLEVLFDMFIRVISCAAPDAFDVLCDELTAAANDVDLIDTAMGVILTALGDQGDSLEALWNFLPNSLKKEVANTVVDQFCDTG